MARCTVNSFTDLSYNGGQWGKVFLGRRGFFLLLLQCREWSQGHITTDVHDNPSSSCWDVTLWIDVADQQADIGILKVRTLNMSSLTVFMFCNHTKDKWIGAGQLNLAFEFTKNIVFVCYLSELFTLVYICIYFTCIGASQLINSQATVCEFIHFLCVMDTHQHTLRPVENDHLWEHPLKLDIIMTDSWQSKPLILSFSNEAVAGLTLPPLRNTMQMCGD